MTGLGVVGLGWLGESLTKEMPGIPDLDVVAVQDIRSDLARDIADRYAIAWSGERFDALLDADGVEAIVICTPNALHAAQAQAALRAGKDVLVQKPLALSADDAQTTIDLAASLGRLLFVDYSYRFLDTVNVFRASLGEVGGARSARAVFHNIYGPGAEKAWFFNPALSGGGALVDLGVHLLDLGLWLFEPVAARLDGVDLSGEGPVESAAALRLVLDDVPLSVDVSWNAPLAASEISFEVRGGDDRRLRWENVDGSFFHFRTLLDGQVIADRETTLREDTLRAFRSALASRRAPPIDARVYALLDQAYGRVGSTR
jgi:predicted dehydrogenase